jgi:hypothetical protein
MALKKTAKQIKAAKNKIMVSITIGFQMTAHAKRMPFKTTK